MIGRIDGIPAHMVQALAGLLAGFIIASGPLVVGVRKAPCAGDLVDPAISAAQVKYLPRLQSDWLAGIHTPHLDTLAEPPDDPVGPGSVEHIGEVLRTLAFQVVQVPLAGQDLILAALIPEAPLGHLLGVDTYRVVKAGLPSSRHRDRRPDRPVPQMLPEPASGPGAPGRKG